MSQTTLCSKQDSGLNFFRRTTRRLASAARYGLVQAVLCAFVLLCGCSDKQGETAAGPAASSPLDSRLMEKYGKAYAGLPEEKLIAISPNNTDIEREYESAFSHYYALQYGRRVSIEWRDVGGGTSSIVQYLRNVYQNSDRSGIDVVWGGGDYVFTAMAAEGILQKVSVAPDVLANIPDKFGGLDLYDSEMRWIGTALSGFGILYNKQLLERLKLPAPTRWEDLGSPRMFDLVGLADPTQSGSAAASYEMIVQSGDDWPDGWAKLLNVLGNAKKFYAGAGDAAEAVPSGEAVAATCIDFYGTNRMAKYPETLVYVSPKGETAFNPDPVGILKNPPHPELAQRFVDFLLSDEGQALWALPAGRPGGPQRVALGRQPIRKDVYVKYAGQFSPAIVDPYAVGQSLAVNTELWSDSYGLLRNLVWAAAVRNLDQLQGAKRKLIDTDFDPERLALFNALPDNVADEAAIKKTYVLMQDDVERDRIVTDWVTYFRDKYERVAR